MSEAQGSEIGECSLLALKWRLYTVSLGFRCFWKMDAKNKTTLTPTLLSCFNQRVSTVSKNQTGIKYPIQAFIGDGLYVFGLIGIFIILKTLMTLNTMLENKPDDHVFMVYNVKAEHQDTTLVQQMAKALENMECSSSLPVSSPSSCDTFSMFASSPPVHSGNGSDAVFTFMEPNQLSQGTSTPISSVNMRTLLYSPDSSTKSLV
ncbi:uncharacterized protein [Pleurodeles waltl]|uniref:uncharacterized protein n=1 Tax=Pleurodeles waltl TaxID=8319 RepID=UPI00370993BC